MSNHGDTEETYGTDYVDAPRNYPGQAPNMLAAPFISSEGQAPHLQATAYTSLPQYPALATSYQNSSYPPTYSFSYNTQWGALPLPEVVSFLPGKGTATTRFQVWIQAPQDIANFPNAAFFIHFREKRVQATFSRVASHDNAYIYMLAADVPLLTTNEQFETIRLTLQMDDGSGRENPFIMIGDFVYEQYDRPVSRSPAMQIASRKRRASNEDSHPAKRYASSNIDARTKAVPRNATVAGVSEHDSISHVSRQGNSIYGTSSAATAVCMPPSTSSTYISGTYLHPTSYQPTVSPVSKSDPIQFEKQGSPGRLKSQTSYRTFPRGSRSPNTKPLRQPSRPHLSISSDIAEPQLIRTSTLQSSVDAAEAGSSSRSYPPFHLYPSKAVLKIEGDLDGMVKNWTPDEISTQRRLVEFQRSQNGNVITTTFKAVRLEDRAPNSICINCIWWEGRGEAYITSVDTIYLLEALVAVRFTVEEKNRIRRNLEGFRPLTVAKGKPESDDFFKLIMGFPNPRPRNIEKDVKAFPWRILAEALKKIIGKYSASYSTPQSNFQPTAMTPSYSLGSALSEESRQIPAPSPRSASISRTSTMHSSAIIPQAQSPASCDATIQAPQSSSGHLSQGSIGIIEPRHTGTHSLPMQPSAHFDSNWMDQHSSQAPSPAPMRQHPRVHPPPEAQLTQQNQRYHESTNIQPHHQQQQQHQHQHQQHRHQQHQHHQQQHQQHQHQHQQQHRPRQPSEQQYLRTSWDYNSFIAASPTLAATPSMVAGSDGSTATTPRHGSQARRPTDSLNHMYFVGAQRDPGHLSNTSQPPPPGS